MPYNNEIPDLEITSYNGVLSKLLRKILKEKGVRTEKELDHLIKMFIGREMQRNRMSVMPSKKITTSSPSAIMKGVLKDDITFKSFIVNLRNLLGVRNIRFSLDVTNTLGNTTKHIMDIDVPREEELKNLKVELSDNYGKESTINLPVKVSKEYEETIGDIDFNESYFINIDSA